MRPSCNATLTSTTRHQHSSTCHCADLHQARFHPTHRAGVRSDAGFGAAVLLNNQMSSTFTDCTFTGNNASSVNTVGACPASAEAAQQHAPWSSAGWRSAAAPKLMRLCTLRRCPRGIGRGPDRCQALLRSACSHVRVRLRGGPRLQVASVVACMCKREARLIW